MFRITVIVILGLFPWTLSGLTIGIFVAFDDDLQSFKTEGATEIRTSTVGKTPIQELRFLHHRVLATKMGSGPVQTALNAQALLSLTKCDIVFSIGPAGGLTPHLNKDGKEWMRVTHVVPWQKGPITGTAKSNTPPPPIPIPIPKNVPESLIAGYPTLKIASGESFIASNEFRTTLRNRTSADAVEMNLFGLIEAINAHGTHSIHLRMISDQADDNASRDFKTFSRGYQGDGGRLLAQLIQALPKDTSDPSSYPGLKKLIIPQPREIDRPARRSSKTD